VRVKTVSSDTELTNR